MKNSSCLDTSVLLAAMVVHEAYHAECHRVLKAGGSCVYAHGLTECFNSLTGGRKPYRVGASIAAAMLTDGVWSLAEAVTLTPREMMRAMGEAEGRGVRGGAIFDYLHLVAARKAKADRMVTLNASHFRAFWRSGDPIVVHPGEV